jgi:hypothetical protein
VLFPQFPVDVVADLKVTQGQVELPQAEPSLNDHTTDEGSGWI